MARVTRDGVTHDIDDSEDSLAAARAKGYKPLITVTKDGKSTYDLDADDTDSVQAAFKKGYSTVESFNNVVQSRKDAQKDVGKLESFTQGVASAATFGFDDEISAALAPGNYDDNIDTVRRMKKDREEANPMTNLAGNIAGGVAVPGLGAAKAATFLGRVGTGAAIGATQGGVQGYGDSEATTLAGNLKDIGTGALIGGTLGGLTGGLIKPRENINAVKEASEGLVAKGKDIASVGSSAFKEGADEAKKIPILGDLPIVGSAPAQAVGGTVKAAKALVEQNNNSKEFKFMVEEFRKHLGPGTRNNFSDEDVVTRMLMEDGPNPAKEWLASASANVNGIAKDDYLSILNKAPETTKAQRLFNKMDEGENLVGTVDEAYKELKSATGKKYDALKGAARSEFQQIANEPVQTISTAMAYANTRKGIGGVNNVLSNVFDDMVGSGTKGFQSLEPAEQFDRILQAKQAVGKAVKWASQNELPEGQKLLQDVYDDLGSHIKKFDTMREADSTYSTFKGIEEKLFKPMAEVNQGSIVGFDPIKLEKIMGQSDTGRRMLKELEKAKELLASGKLEQGQAESVSRMIKSVEDMVENAAGKRALDSFRQRNSGPSGPAIDRLGASIRKDSTLDSALRTPETFLRKRENITDLAPSVFSKSYKELNEAEQTAIIKYHSWLASNEKAVPAEKARALNLILENLKISK